MTDDESRHVGPGSKAVAVTVKIGLSSPEEVDDEVEGWLRRA